MDDYRSKSKLEGNQVIIKGRSYTTKTLNQLPETLSSFSTTSQSDNTSIGFFGELNVFSNFHPAPFTLHGIKFHSSEEYIQYQKSMLFKDHDTCHQILDSKDALEAKRKVRDVQSFDYRKWKDCARELCEPGILVKV